MKIHPVRSGRFFSAGNDKKKTLKGKVTKGRVRRGKNGKGKERKGIQSHKLVIFEQHGEQNPLHRFPQK